MTQRDLPIGPATVMPLPTVVASTGSWTTGGLSDFIDDAHFQALKAMSGLTVDPEIANDVLHINGRAHHVIEQLDNDIA